MKPIGVIGAHGRMGQEIVAVLDSQKLRMIPMGRADFNIQQVKKCSVVIDFTTADSFSDVVKLVTSAKVPLVSGTTGITVAQKKQLQAASATIPVLWSANMSLGVAVLKQALETLRALEDFDFQVEEFHHNKKKDKPSGTALVLQEKLKKVLSTEQQRRLAEPVAIRAGGIFGVHKVYAVSDEEQICFEHQALNRRVFAVGAVRAAQWLAKQKKGLYGIEDLLNVR